MDNYRDAADAVSSLGRKWGGRGFKLWFKRYDHGTMMALALTLPNNQPLPYAAKLVMKSPPYPSCEEIVALNDELEGMVFDGAGHG